MEEEMDVDVNMDEEPATPPMESQSLVQLLTPPLLALATPTSLSFPPLSFPSIHPPTTSALGTMHIRALECLNNLFLGSSEEAIPTEVKEAGVDVWRRVWGVLKGAGEPREVLGGVGVGGQERRREMWEVGVGVLWGLARVCKGELVSFECVWRGRY